MTHIVFDVGNAHIVFATFKDDRLDKKFRVPTEKCRDEISKIIGDLEKVESALVASVNDPAGNVVEEVLSQNKIGFKRVHAASKLKIEVDSPNQVGEDLIANAHSALAMCKNRDLLIVDIGTAITVQAVDKNGSFLGAVILPGINMSARALTTEACLLPLVDVQKPKTILGENTETAIQSGIYYGNVLGTVEYFLTHLKEELFQGKEVASIATGGLFSEPLSSLGRALKKDLKVDIIEPDLTLIGLYQILKGDKK